MNSKLKHDASVFVDEARSRLKDIDGASVAQLAVELALSGWTPPDPISPRLRAAREYAKGACNGRMARENAESDFLAGVAWAVEKAGPLVKQSKRLIEEYLDPDGEDALTTYRQEIGDE